MLIRSKTETATIRPTNGLRNNNNNDNKRRRSSMLRSFKNFLLEEEPVLNLKPDLTTSVKESVKHEQEMENDINKVLQTTQIYAGEDMGNIKERDDIIDLIINEYSKEDLANIFKKIITGLDNKQNKNDKDNRNANS